MPRLPLIACIVLVGCAGSGASAPASIPPRPEDVASVDGIMKAFYEVVNVGPNAPRQWDRDRTLYVPWIRFVSIGRTGAVTIYDHPKFVADTEPLIQKGFRERELFRRTRVYGNMVHVDSTYEAVMGGERWRGVNSIDCYFDGKRWWIASVVWQSEAQAIPIPADLLPPAP